MTASKGKPLAPTPGVAPLFDRSAKNVEHTETLSLSPKEQLVDGLRKLIPGIGNDGKIDLEAIKAALGDIEESTEDRFIFSWNGKNAAILRMLRQTSSTLRPRRDASIKFDESRNLLIKGDNLESLKALYNSYFNRVKFIYIDPVYNTGGDLIYNDDFSESRMAYLKSSGQIDEYGALLISNPETGGRYHSTWLSMMYPRLFLARQLLREDGIIVVSIDDHEVANLRLLMNEIFGEENFVGTVIWNSTKSVTNTALISVSHTYNLIFARSRAYFKAHRSHFRLPEPGEGFSNPDADPRGPWKADPFQVGGERPNQLYTIVNPKTGEKYKPKKGNSWKNDKDTYDKLVADNRIVFGLSGEAGPQRKRFQSEAEERGRVTKTLWDDVDTTTNATRDLDKLFDGEHVFDNPKPVDLIKRFISLGVHDPENAIVLDFFGGSGTTAQAVMELNAEDGGTRRFILVQVGEPINDDIGYKTIFDVCRERLARVAKRSTNSPGFRVLELTPSNFPEWRLAPGATLEEYQKQIHESLNVLPKGANKNAITFEVSLKEGYGATITTSRVDTISDNEVIEVRDPDTARSFHVCLDTAVKPRTVKALQKSLGKTDLFVCLDSALSDSDCANLAMTCRLKTI